MATSTTSSASFGLFSPLPKLSAFPKPTRNLPPSTVTELSLSRKLQLISEREGEDAALTGGTRSLHRRLLALNLQGSVRLGPSKTVPSLAQPLSA